MRRTTARSARVVGRGRAQAPRTGEAAAFREFQKICGARDCRRGDIGDVKAAWAAQLEQWQRDETDRFAGALVEGGPGQHRSS